MTENGLLELYCIVDDFYQKFVETKAGERNLSLYYSEREPNRSIKYANCALFFR